MDMEERIHHRRQEEPRGATDSALSSGDESTDSGVEEFEFPCFLGGDHATPALADDLFADGRIRPATFYPVFGRRSVGDIDGAGLAALVAPAPERRTRGQLGRLFLEESRAWNSSTSSSSSTGSSESTSSSSAAADDLEGAAPDSYCVWAPGGSSASSPRPPLPRKSGSTGSMARWRRVSDLVVGRSHSDGKEKFLFLPANPPTPPIKKNPATKPVNKAAAAKKKTAPSGTEINTVAAAQRMAHYGAAKAVGAGGGGQRRTFLPYREELVGFFASVHGMSRSHPHPY